MNAKLQLIFACNFNVAASAAVSVSVSVALYVWPTYGSCKNSITEKKKRKINWETALDAAKIDKRDTDTDRDTATDTQSNQKRGEPRLPQLGTISTWDALRSAQLGVVVGAGATWRRNRNRNQNPRRSHTHRDTLTRLHPFPCPFPIYVVAYSKREWNHLPLAPPSPPLAFPAVLCVLVSFYTQRHTVDDTGVDACAYVMQSKCY